MATFPPSTTSSDLFGSGRPRVEIGATAFVRPGAAESDGYLGGRKCLDGQRHFRNQHGPRGFRRCLPVEQQRLLQQGRALLPHWRGREPGGDAEGVRTGRQCRCLAPAAAGSDDVWNQCRQALAPVLHLRIGGGKNRIADRAGGGLLVHGGAFPHVRADRDRRLECGGRERNSRCRAGRLPGRKHRGGKSASSGLPTPPWPRPCCGGGHSIPGSWNRSAGNICRETPDPTSSSPVCFISPNG